MANLEDLKLQQQSLFGKLKDAYFANSPEYAELKAQIDALTAQIYSPTKEEDIKKNQASSSDTAYIPVRTEQQKAQPQHKSLTVITEQQIEKMKATQRSELLDGKNIRNNEEGLNTLQIEAATGKNVLIGGSALNARIYKGDGPFSYVLEERPGRDNHVISCDLRGGVLTIIDSNGDPLPDKDREILRARHPEIEINYLDKDGNKINEQYATADNLLRVQFDDFNCGMYTTNIVNMLDAANGSEKFIKAGIEQIKEITNNPAKHRNELANMLTEMAQNPSMEENIQQNFAKTFQSIRLAEKSPSVDEAKTYPQFIKDIQIEKTTEKPESRATAIRTERRDDTKENGGRAPGA